LQAPQNYLYQQQLINNIAMLVQQQMQQQLMPPPSPVQFITSPQQQFAMPQPNLSTPSPILGRIFGGNARNEICEICFYQCCGSGMFIRIQIQEPT
jgi:hypothetical protein